MKALSKILTVLLASMIVFLAPVTAVAADEFNAGLKVETVSSAEIKVTVEDSDVLREKKPLLTVYCGDVDWENASVKTPSGEIIPCTWDSSKKSATFTVEEGGAYTITKAARTSEASGYSYRGSGNTIQISQNKTPGEESNPDTGAAIINAVTLSVAAAAYTFI